MAKILVIDDSGFQRKFLRGFLEEAGHEVEDFLPVSGLEVLEKVKAWPPDLVVTDYAMPHLNGMEVTRMIRRALKDVPIVMLTASWNPERDARLKTMGVRKILHKPMTGPDLVEALKDLV